MPKTEKFEMAKKMTAADYLSDIGTMPALRDSVPPWKYKGWLLFYVQEIQRVHPAIPDRWGYLAETIDKGSFLAQPIPKIHFATTVNPKPQANIKECIDILDMHGFWASFRVFIDWLGFALGTAKKYPREVTPGEAEALYKTLNVGPMLLHPYDHLGHWLSSTQGKGWNPNAFYPTPHGVCQAMTEMTMHDIESKAKQKGVDIRALSVCDPCAGTGRMLLHASNYSMNLCAQDIDSLVLSVLKINAALYAPWLIVRPTEAIRRSKDGQDKEDGPANN